MQDDCFGDEYSLLINHHEKSVVFFNWISQLNYIARYTSIFGQVFTIEPIPLMLVPCLRFNQPLNDDYLVLPNFVAGGITLKSLKYSLSTKYC